MTKIGVLILILFVMLVVSVFGAHFGYAVDGVPKGGDFSLVQGMSYFYDMTTFNIDGMPAEMSAVFILITLLSIYIIVTSVLPGGG